MRNPTHYKKRGIVKGFPIISLFSGAGGLDLGFKQAGFNTILAIDNDRAACQTFMSNNPKCDVLRMDLATIDPKNFLDRISGLPQENYPVGVIGGPPCQAFSLGNALGATDVRFKSLFEILRRPFKVVHLFDAFYFEITITSRFRN
jgi:site-specific DNA-cytosine methylase